jgi:hypothetical protein
MKSVWPFLPPKQRFAGVSGTRILAISLRSEPMNINSIAGARENAAFGVATDSVWSALIDLTKHLSARESFALEHIKFPDVPGLSGIGDV